MFLGISDAVFIFTAMMKPVRVYLALKGIPTAIYIDDQFVLGKDEEQCAANNCFPVEVLGKVDRVVSPSKSTGPASRLAFLGLDICSVEQKFFIPEKKLLSKPGDCSQGDLPVWWASSRVVPEPWGR